MNKLTAEKCRQFIISMKSEQDRNQLSITGGYQLQALEIALPVLEQQEKESNPPIDNGGWIEWKGGECPVAAGTYTGVEFRGGYSDAVSAPEYLDWHDDGLDGDIIAYRVIEIDGREE